MYDDFFPGQVDVKYMSFLHWKPLYWKKINRNTIMQLLNNIMKGLYCLTYYRHMPTNLYGFT